jgi:hypothetical protein
MVLVLALGCACGAKGGEFLTPESLLPVAGEKGDLDAHRPGAAFGKDVFLVVWQVGMMQGTDLVGCRVDKGGKAIDAKPFVVSSAKDGQERPRLAFGKDVFLAVWQDIRNEKDYDTYATRISPEGKVLDPDGILIAGGDGNQSRPRVIFDGTSFLVAWEDRRDGKCYEIYGARVSPEGKVLDAGGVKLVGLKDDKERSGFDRSMPALASSGDGRTLLVWHGTKYWVGSGTGAGSVFVKDGKVEKDNGDLQGIQDRNGGIGGGGRGGSPISACAGKEGYLVLWRNHRPVGRGGGGDGSNCALFIDKDGKWNKGESLSLSGKPHVAMDPEAAWDGSGFVAAWGEQPGAKGKGVWDVVGAARTDGRGQPAGGAIAVAGSMESPAARPCVASDGAGVSLIAYEKHPATADVPVKIGFRVLTAR